MDLPAEQKHKDVFSYPELVATCGGFPRPEPCGCGAGIRHPIAGAGGRGVSVALPVSRRWESGFCSRLRWRLARWILWPRRGAAVEFGKCGKRTDTDRGVAAAPQNPVWVSLTGGRGQRRREAVTALNPQPEVPCSFSPEMQRLGRLLTWWGAQARVSGVLPSLSPVGECPSSDRVSHCCLSPCHSRQRSRWPRLACPLDPRSQARSPPSPDAESEPLPAGGAHGSRLLFPAPSVSSRESPNSCPPTAWTRHHTLVALAFPARPFAPPSAHRPASPSLAGHIRHPDSLGWPPLQALADRSSVFGDGCRLLGHTPTARVRQLNSDRCPHPCAPHPAVSPEVPVPLRSPPPRQPLLCPRPGAVRLIGATHPRPSRSRGPTAVSFWARPL